ncbi:hypothetical protein ACI68E_003268 [Malassezia pachydermatis]|uniref:Uncharacterized protein n=1 Tax=Malassezia pachydermatis TaxID=77020 RepID=A0A0M8MV85_9BASI|nr:hypothetical protein Malapachy_4107 [Malassezia pachydermatis]KOS14440.1 hypothetical protein Malapachy_4107 [Malassezia pachydermatis]
MMTQLPLRHVYRHLLRAAAASVRFSRTDVKSIRQILRAELERIPTHASPQSVQVFAEQTMAWLLLASLHRRPVHEPQCLEGSPYRPSSSSPASALAQRLTKNLASLSYHHLSPHTQMQPPTRRTGGSKTDTSSKAPSALASALAEHDELWGGSTAMPGKTTTRLDVLTVAAKPMRGPVQHRMALWDGQHPEKHIRAAADDVVSSAAELPKLQQKLDTLKAQWDTMKEQYGPTHPRTQAARDQFQQLRGTVKGMKRMDAQRQAKERIRRNPARHLTDIVRLAAESESLWLGLPRWEAWAHGEYLPP